VRNLYIHLGPAKTGTSAIQHALSAHDGSAVTYPRAGRWSDGSHHALVFGFFNDRARLAEAPEPPADLMAAIAGEAANTAQDVMISSEALAGRDLAGFCAALLAQMPGDVRLEFILVAREHYSWTASLYNQRVKDGVIAETCSPDEYLARRASFRPYAGLVRSARRTGHPVTVLDYHPARDLVSRFLLRLGFSAAQVPQQELRNVSLSRKALVAMLAINRHGVTGTARESLYAALKSMRDCYVVSEFIFSADAAKAAETMFSQDRLFLREQFGIALPAPDLARERKGLYVSEAEFADIALALDGTGETARAVVQACAGFVL
jgi:hypothetical protein